MLPNSLVIRLIVPLRFVIVEVVDGALFDKGQEEGEAGVVGVDDAQFRHHSSGQIAIGGVKALQGNSKLFEIVSATDAVRGFPALLNRWQEEADEHADDADDHQDFHQTESPALGRP